MSACFDSPGAFTTQPTATPHRLDAGMGRLPLRHLLAQVAFDFLRELLENRAGGAPAAGTGAHHRCEGAQSHGLEDLLRHLHFARTLAAGLGRERNADRVADAFLQQHCHRRRRGDDALGAHARLGQPEMQRVVAALAQAAVDRNEVLHLAHLAGDDDLFGGESPFLRLPGGTRVGTDHRFAHDLRGFERRGKAGIIVHHAGEELLVELPQFTPMPTGLVVGQGALDHRGELLVALCPLPTLPG